MVIVHFHNVGANRISFRRTLPSVSDETLLLALLSGLNSANNSLSFHVDTDGRTGQVLLKPGRIVALFDLEPERTGTRTPIINA